MSTLETSVTLDDVFTVVEAKRVPLAPELAGYLTLEIADGTDAGSGDVDPRTVFVSEEGTVALVRPKRDSIHGDAEASVRALLAKLLEAGGGGTPALTTAARRKPGNGLPALVEELETALIPVNRAAGRRALARLAREVRRVLLGVGRNASAPVQVRSDLKPPTAPRSRPALRKRSSGEQSAADPKAIEAALATSAPTGENAIRRTSKFEDEPETAKRANLLAGLLSDEGKTETTAVAKAPHLDAPAPGGTPRPPPSVIPPPPGASASSPPGPPPPPKRDATPAPIGTELRSKSESFGDEVDSLLNSFAVSSAHEDKQMAREIKAIAGLSPTPPPPDAKTLAELTKDIGSQRPPAPASPLDGDSVEALLALTDAGRPAGETPPPAANVPSSPLRTASPASTRMPASRREPVATPDPRREPTVPRRGRLESIGDPMAPPAKHGRTRRGEAPRAPKTGLAMLIFALFVVAGGTVAIWSFAPHVFTGRRTAPSASVAPTASAAVPPKCKAALVLTDVPANAEILLRMGQAPIDVERMPVGTRLELVATAEGYLPRRAVVKSDATWDKGSDGKPRIDVPIQLDPSKAKPGAAEPWPAAEPGSQVGGSGAPGTMHVVSNVRGAEIWLLAGLGPEARIDQLRCEGEIDVLLAGPPALRRRLHVGEKEIAAVAADPAGNKVITISAK